MSLRPSAAAALTQHKVGPSGQTGPSNLLHLARLRPTSGFHAHAAGSFKSREWCSSLACSLVDISRRPVRSPITSPESATGIAANSASTARPTGAFEVDFFDIVHRPLLLRSRWVPTAGDWRTQPRYIQAWAALPCFVVNAVSGQYPAASRAVRGGQRRRRPVPARGPGGAKLRSAM